jgi:hypothetical protein
MGARINRCLGMGLALLVGVACGDSTGPGIQPQITNVTDNFQYQVTAVQGYSGVLTYHWQNTGTTATVNQATTVTAGTMTLVVKDAAGTEVYNQSLATNGTLDTAAGTAGLWTIVVTYANASGTVNFRVQKKP